jgi:hypothetical protein
MCSIAFVISITDALEPCAALPLLTLFSTVFDLQASLNTFRFHLPASFNAFRLSPSINILIVDFFDGQVMSPECH